jgi:hypothetical protein
MAKTLSREKPLGNCKNLREFDDKWDENPVAIFVIMAL